MATAKEMLFKQMGGREAYDDAYRLNPVWSAWREDYFTRAFDYADDRAMEDDAKYIDKANPAKGIAKWNVINGWQHEIEWALANPGKLPRTKLKIYRSLACLTQQQLADLSGINIRQIQKLESGEISIENVTAKTLMALADALKMEPCELL